MFCSTMNQLTIVHVLYVTFVVTTIYIIVKMIEKKVYRYVPSQNYVVFGVVRVAMFCSTMNQLTIVTCALHYNCSDDD